MFSSPLEARKACAKLEGLTIEEVSKAPLMAARSLNVHAGQYPAPVRHGYDDGETFYGGMGPVQVNVPDYWTLRQRSAHVFETSQYARGIIRRLVTNVIATGLHLEVVPNETLLGYDEEGLAEWSEDVETRFTLWANDPYLCDTAELTSFGEIQAQAWLEALVCGDVLVVLQQGTTKAPKVRLVPGDAIRTPWSEKAKKGNRIEHGVEIDGQGRHVAFWVYQADQTFKRLPAWGEKSGRRLAWLVYGSDKRANDVRGRPLLSLILQSLTELDKYRSSTQRKALINSILSVWIEKTEEKLGGADQFFNGTGGSEVLTNAAATSTEPRSFRHAEHLPGFIHDQLDFGEKIHPHAVQGVTESYGDFEQAIVQGMAWALELPPEILTLSFSSNYSASKAAMGEFDVYLYRHREWIGKQLCVPIYEDWLISQCLAGAVKAPKFLESWRATNAHVIYRAWLQSDWAGHLRGHLDPVKQMAGYNLMLEAGVVTRDRVARWTSGQKFSRVTKQLKRENEALAEALAPLQALETKNADPTLHMVEDDEPAKKVTK